MSIKPHILQYFLQQEVDNMLLQSSRTPQGSNEALTLFLHSHYLAGLLLDHLQNSVFMPLFNLFLEVSFKEKAAR